MTASAMVARFEQLDQPGRAPLSWSRRAGRIAVRLIHAVSRPAVQPMEET
ncbi:hypothetical protein ABGB17_30855 [Sphaerisporangium sp. B11E5]